MVDITQLKPGDHVEVLGTVLEVERIMCHPSGARVVWDRKGNLLAPTSTSALMLEACGARKVYR